MSDEFYVGYLPKAPEHLGRTVLRIIIALSAVAVVIALLLVFGQQPFADSRFEFLQYRDYEGVIVSSPYPGLLTAEGPYLLVAPGKHGADDLVRDLRLRKVQLRGSLIRRGDDKMLELDPGSIRATGGSTVMGSPTSLGAVTLTGEIVDSKCYFGVMNPGNGKVHRDCAARCISGGLPPAFIVRDSSGKIQTLLLAGADGRKLNRKVLDFVAEPIRISGELIRSNGILILNADPRTLHRVVTTRE